MSTLRNKIYYGVKPLLPLAMRNQVRRWFALRKRKEVSDAWPILPGSESPPVGWKGWPDGKKFAVVLTHDIEGPAGLARCRRLMELEMKWGFRSSFNFIPEGNYRVSRELREELTRNGFEVGLHDLYHDGGLYKNRNYFSAQARKINQHLKDWGAVGFRSGFMMHNLEWLHELDIQYDASTFDTDPFEPQPDNLATIFPFLVDGPGGRAYLELPYTLPQDSTLFLLLGETSPAIWLQKLDWLASKGGMALLNMHPDYAHFEDEPAGKRTFPIAHYEKFLKYISEHYAGQYWHVLPKKLAAWHRSNYAPLTEFKTEKASVARNGHSVLNGKPVEARTPVMRNEPRRICMVAYSNYDTDNRVIRYAEELARRGDHVEVLALKRQPEQPTDEILNGVHVTRVQTRLRKDEKKRVSYFFPLLTFWLRCAARLTWRHAKQRYDLIHVHNMPVFLVFTALIPKLTGARVVLDIHDIVPEFYSSKFDIASTSRGVAALKKVEWASARFSNHVIISNHLWRETFVARTAAEKKCSVFINNVNSNIFKPRPRLRTDGKFIILFPGGLQWHQGLDIAVRAFHKISGTVPEAELHIYGDGPMKQNLIDLTRELGLQEKVRFFDPLPVHQIADVMANADLGVVPKRADSFGNEAYSTKIMEFMALGVPMIVSSTKIDRFYFNDSVVRFFPSGDDEALAAAMLEMICNRDLRTAMARRASDYAVENSWETRKDDYLNLVDSLCSKGRNGAAHQ